MVLDWKANTTIIDKKTIGPREKGFCSLIDNPHLVLAQSSFSARSEVFYCRAEQGLAGNWRAPASIAASFCPGWLLVRQIES